MDNEQAAASSEQDNMFVQGYKEKMANTIRIASLNVHSWASQTSENNTGRIIHTIKLNDIDVVRYLISYL